MRFAHTVLLCSCCLVGCSAKHKAWSWEAATQSVRAAAACEPPQGEVVHDSMQGFAWMATHISYQLMTAQLVLASDPSDPTALYELSISAKSPVNEEPGPFHAYVNLCHGGIWIRDELTAKKSTKYRSAFPWYRPRVRVQRVVAVADGTEYAVIRLANGIRVYCIGPDEGDKVVIRDTQTPDTASPPDPDGKAIAEVPAGSSMLIRFSASSVSPQASQPLPQSGTDAFFDYLTEVASEVEEP